MSRIGKKPVTIPAGVQVTIDGSNVTVKGPKGELKSSFDPAISIAMEGNEIIVTRPSDVKEHRSLHGLTRTLVANMVTGVTEGFKKELQVNGVGYRVAKQGKNLVMNLGYSHQVIMPEPDGITVECPGPNKSEIITGLRRVSKPGLRIYTNVEDMPRVMKGLGIAILSTSKGIMTDKQARALNVGGEVLAYIW